MDLKKLLSAFFDAHVDPDKPIGLAFSGGGDSTCLLHILHLLKRQLSNDLHVLHVNHNWRKESTQEAYELQVKVEKMGYKFHNKDLEKPTHSSNLEDRAREKRLTFYQEIASKYHLQGIFLAHHKDDLAETILKRLFEGSQLSNLSGMRLVQKMGTTLLFRPFLTVPKKELLEYLQKNSIQYIEDETNNSEKFLRGRFRKKILPFLEKNFQKNVIDNILLFQERTNELYSYIEKKISNKIPQKKEGPFGVYYDFNSSNLNDQLEWRYALLTICKENDYTFSKELIDKAVISLQGNKANKRFEQNNVSLHCDRKMLFFPKKQGPLTKDPVFLKIGKQGISNIMITLQEALPNKLMKNTWKDLWIGSYRTYLPEGKYELVPFHALDLDVKKKFRKKWSKQKIPHFFRESVPLVSKNGKDIQDLLSCKMIEIKEGKVLELSINFS